MNIGTTKTAHPWAQLKKIMSEKLESETPSDAATCSRLARCSACGRITDDFVRYGSLAYTETCPSEMPHVCGSDCMAVAADKIESGEWQPPKLRSAMGGNAWDISKPRKGYDAQPSQAELIKALLHAANALFSLFL